MRPALEKWIRRGVSPLAYPLGTITQVDTREPVAALTFDDGPDPEWTPPLLDVLARHGARATFFMVGARAERHPELVRKVAAAGHAIGNHSWDHPSLVGLGAAQRRQQIRRCEQALAPYGERLFRPPHGHQTAASFVDARRLGYRVVTWSMVAEDFRGEDGDTVLGLLRARVRPGSIALLHDSLYTAGDERHRDRTATLWAVDALLEERAGFEFVTVPELLRRGRALYWPWYRKPVAGAAS